MADDSKAYVNTQAPVQSGERTDPIKVNTENLSSMISKGPGYIEHVTLSAPVQIDRLFGVKTGAEAAALLEESKRMQAAARGQSQPRRVNASVQIDTLYARGDVLFDRKYGKKVTVLRVLSNDGGRVVYEVASRSGDKWRQREKNLERA